MKRIVNYRPAFCFAIAMIAGIVAAGFSLESYLARTVMMIASAVVVAVLFICKKGSKSAYVAAFVLGLCLLSGACDIYNGKTVYAEDAKVTARVISLPSKTYDYYRYTVDRLEVNGKSVKGKAYVYSDEATLELGDAITFSKDVSAEQFTTYWEFLQHYAAKVYYEFTISDYEVIGSGGAPLASKVKRAVAVNVYSTLRADTGDIIMALVFGEKSDIDYDLYNDVGATGLAHLFAVSGLHIGFLAAAVIWLLKKIKTTALARLIITPSVLLLYALLCGFPPSVIRATVMTTVYLIADVIGAKKDGLSTLSVAAVICLLIQPVGLFMAGFQMSFLAVLGLILFTRSGKQWLPKLPRQVGEITKTCVATNLLLLPVMMDVFKEIPLMFIPANIIILPITPFIYIFLLFNVAITTILPFLAPLNYLSALAVMPIKLLSFTIGSFGINTVAVPSIGLLAIGFYAVIIVCSRFVFLRPKTKAIASSGIATATVIAAIFI